MQENWISLGGSFFICHGISIVIPRSSGILEWVEYQNMGSYQVTIELPPNWYENNDLLGFALRCVYVASPNESQYESAHTSEDEPNNRFAFASEIERLVFFCILSVRGNNQSAKVDVFSFESRSVNDGVSDTVWLIFYPKVAFKEAIKSRIALVNGHTLRLHLPVSEEWKSAGSVLYTQKILNRSIQQWHKAVLFMGILVGMDQ